MMPNALTQNLVVLVVVAGAIAYLAKRVWRAYRAATSTRCSDNCGCGH